MGNRRAPGPLVFLLLAASVGTAMVARPGAAQNRASVTTVILVRHAEKADDSRDPPLSAAGRARAAALAHVLGDVAIDAVYSTPFVRTRETARPLADRAGVPVREIAATRTYVEDIATRIREQHRAETIVIVGHSNTTPAVIRALGVGDPPALADHEYDDLFVLIITDGARPVLLRLHYGVPTP